MHRSRIALGLLFVIVVTVAVILSTGRFRRTNPERVVLIVIDTLRSDYLSCYGGSTPTPNIDALAQNGQMFTNVIASFHQTTMSMAALFTGRTPSISSGDAHRALGWTGETWCGLSRFDTTGEDTCVPQGLTTLAERFDAAGYRTIGIVSNPLLYRPYGYDQGFHEWHEVARGRVFIYRTGDLVNELVRKWLAGRGTDRFFLYVHYMDVHDRREPERDRESRRKVYSDSVLAVDRAIGELMELLRTAELLDGTVVILAADHGERLGEVHPLEGPRGHWGNPSFEPVLRVPLIVTPPTGEKSDRLLRSDDVSRLIAGVAGLRHSEEEDLEPGEVFLTEIGYRTYREGEWKSFWPRHNVPPMAQDRHLMLRPKTLEPALFNIADDPDETFNLAAERPHVLARHRERVDALTETLATTSTKESSITPLDRERLRALGYLD